jgi:hypothetical protein
MGLCRHLHRFFVVITLAGSIPLFADDFTLLPDRPPFLSYSSLDFRYYLFTGTEENRLVNHGNFGLEFPVFGYEPWKLSAGIAAAAHLVMYPVNMRFPVDNFYATLATYVDVVPTSHVSFRFYPVYHVSGHLADGTLNDSELAHPVAVSAEMSKIETDIKPLKGLSLSVGYGRYYHVCAQKDLTDHLDAAIRIQPWQKGVWQPFAIVSGEIVHMAQWYPGFDMEIGSQFASVRKHAIGVSLRWFDRLNPGYYFTDREKSVGIQFDFLL